MTGENAVIMVPGAWGQSRWDLDGYYAVGRDSHGNSYEVRRPSRRGANHYETHNGVTKRTKGHALIHNGRKP